MRLFVAGPSAMRSIIGRIIQEELPRYGCSAYDWTNDPGFSNPCNFDAKRSAMKDLEELDAAEGVLWYVDMEFPSQGAPFEAGYALAKGKPIAILRAGYVPAEWIYTHSFGPHFGHLGEAISYLERKTAIHTDASPRPIGATLLADMPYDTPLWDAEQTKKLLQALEAKMCGLVDVLSERIDQVSDRLDKLEGVAHEHQ